jgi:hypothetical protein
MIEGDDAPSSSDALDTPPDGEGYRRFTAAGSDWVVTVEGHGATGFGTLGRGRIQLLRFAHADSPDRPVAELLVAPRPLMDYFESELGGLLRYAQPVRPPEAHDYDRDPDPDPPDDAAP